MTPGYPDRFLELFARRGERVAVFNGAIYKLYRNMVVPFGPANADYSLSASDSSSALELLGGVLVRTTGGFDRPGVRGDWYAVICRRFTDVEEIRSSNTRSKLRRGLRHNEVRRMSPEELARCGYDIYVKAQERYHRPSAPLSQEAFASHAMSADGCDDIVHHWGVFRDGQLVGYSSNYVFGTTEASYSTIRFHPTHLTNYISYALFHHMNRHYLAESGFSYVNDGFRSILHKTRVQDFLEHEFGFERVDSDVDVRYRWPYGMLIRTTFPFRNLIGGVDDRFRALYELERLARAGRP